jgi:hypothetical protein
MTMTRISTVVGGLMVAAIAAACGGGQQTPNDSMSSMPAPAAPGTTAGAQTLDIMLMSKPDPPAMGSNTFEVMVMSGGQPVTDADVSVDLFMAAMPSMNMPEMKNTVMLTHQKDGTYSGTGQVTMAGAWDATVMVKRGGAEIGSKKVQVTAK